jgi:hypothetical protein
LSLRVGIEKIFLFIDELREEKKRGRLPLMYSRLEVSFGKKNLGFNPHLNIISFGNPNHIKDIATRYGLKIWYQKKDNQRDTALSIAWYILKFNNIGIEKGEAVRKVLNRRTTLLHSKEFNHKSINYIDEYIDLNFSFMGVYPIRTKMEIEVRKLIQDDRRKINQKFKRLMKDVKIFGQ